MTQRRSTSAFLVAAALASAACGSATTESTATTDTALFGEDATDTSDVETQTSSLTAAFTLAQTAEPTRDLDTALAAADQARTYFAPAGCLSTAIDTAAHSVTYTLDACFGPWGLARMSGTITATYALTTAADGSSVLDIDVTSDMLRLNRATASYHASATVKATGLAREMTWNGDLTGTTARGRAFERTATWNVVWTIGQSCVRLDGTTTGSVAARTFSTTVTNFVRCRGECPQAGGDVALVETKTGRAIDIQYTGSNVATVRDDGTTSAVTLACTP